MQKIKYINFIVIILVFEIYFSIELKAEDQWIQPSPSYVSEVSNFQWDCPSDKKIKIIYSSKNKICEIKIKAYDEEKNVTNFESHLFSEYLGLYDLPFRKFRWEGKNLFLTKTDNGFSILSISEAIFLFNTSFTTYLAGR